MLILWLFTLLFRNSAAASTVASRPIWLLNLGENLWDESSPYLILVDESLGVKETTDF